MDRPAHVTVTDADRVATDTVRLTLDATWDASPGQFAMVWVPGEGEKPMSVVASDPLAVCVRSVGPFSRSLCSRTVGDKIGVRGPYGTGFTITEDTNALLVAGGMGAAPLAFLARELATGNEVTTLLGARTADQLIMREAFRDTGGLHIFTDDGSSGMPGIVTSSLDTFLGDADRVYACGPERMMAAVLDAALEAGIPCELCVERYMKCGVGLCGSCHVGEICACTDGPVLLGERLDGTGFGRTTRDRTGRRVPV
ncbi:MAG: dihydroorotate dehydrogenase electron transfer subunit [Methanopyri archaeon]|nr:dihydroorotate dehydrogenase electron transfer subunit [Methanopyri archaeon]